MSKPPRVALPLLVAVGLLCSLAAADASADDGYGSLELDENNWTKVLTDEWMVLLWALVLRYYRVDTVNVGRAIAYRADD